MKKMQSLLAAACTATLVFAAGSALAASDGKTVTLQTTINSYANLTINSPTLTFPDSFASLPAAQATTYTAMIRQTSAGGATLAIVGANLAGASTSIPATGIQLTPTITTGTGAINSTITLSTSSQTAVTYANSGVYTGTLTFDLTPLGITAYQALPVDTYTGVQSLTLSTP